MIKKPKYVLAAGGPLRAPGPIPRKVFLASKSVAVFVLRQGFSEAGFFRGVFEAVFLLRRVFVQEPFVFEAGSFRGRFVSGLGVFWGGGFLGRGWVEAVFCFEAGFV